MAKVDQKKNERKGSSGPQRTAMTRPSEEDRESVKRDMLAAKQQGFDELYNSPQESTGEDPGVVDKDVLVDVPMVIVRYVFKRSTKSTPGKGHGMFVRVHALIPDSSEVIFTDSSDYGVCQQLLDREEQGLPQKFRVRGLNRSSYGEEQRPDGSVRPAGTTFYLDTSPSREDMQRRIAANKGAVAVNQQRAVNSGTSVRARN